MMNNEDNILNIFKLFKALQDKGITFMEVQRDLKIKTQTFFKYMKYFKNAGFDIRKTGNVYKINKYSDTLELNEKDIKFIADVCVDCENMLAEQKSDKALETIEKILLMTNSATYKKVKNAIIPARIENNNTIYKDKINLFEKLLKRNLLTEVTLKSKTVFFAKPYKITYKKSKVYFNFVTKENKIKTILADRIVNMEPEYFLKIGNPFEKETIFELYGNLAKKYILREDEVIVDNFEGGVRIANHTKDKTLLFKRLLRYDVLCKIIYPKSDKIKFKEIINKSIENINRKEQDV